MTKDKTNYWINKMKAKGWHLDTHSTILSRKHEAHKCIGNLRFVKPIKIIQREQVLHEMIDTKMRRHALSYEMGADRFIEVQKRLLEEWQPGGGIRRDVSC